MPIQDSDLLVVGRGDSSYKITYDDLKTKLEDDGLGGGGGGECGGHHGPAGCGPQRPGGQRRAYGGAGGGAHRGSA